MSTKNDVIVAARVPAEIKEQGNILLTKLGFTPTQLINAAYRYLLEHREFPFEQSSPQPGKRALSEERLKQITEEMDALQVSTFDYSLDDARSFKDALAGELKADYERLA